jgi:transcription initiation factor IIE alpha subunit
MKTVFIALIVFFTMGNVVVAQTTTVTAKKEVQKTMYTCPMHPKVMSDKKGKCPKCGMDLVVSKEKVQKITVAKSKYVCTMDDSTSDKPGKCPKCGMAMTERKPEKK